MSITSAIFTERVYQAVSKGLPEANAGIMRTACEACLPDALNTLGVRTAKNADPAVRAYLQASTALTLSGGEIAIPQTVLYETIGSAGVTLSGITEPLQFLPHYQDLLNPPVLSDFTYYTIHEGKIKVRDSNGGVPTATALTVFSSIVPTISQIPVQLEDDLVDTGVELVTARMGAAA